MGKSNEKSCPLQVTSFIESTLQDVFTKHEQWLIRIAAHTEGPAWFVMCNICVMMIEI